MEVTMKPIACFVLSIALTAGCDRIADQFDIDRPSVLSVAPEHLSENISSHTAITVVFSKEMDRIKTHQAFTLSAHKTGNVEGFFSWRDGRTLCFTPRTPLSDNCYTIRVDTSAEDTKGNDLAEIHESVFYVNTDLTPPEILSHTPADNAIGVHPFPASDPEHYASSFIRMVFSEPIDLDSLYSGFSITPSVQGLFSWNETHTEILFTQLSDLLPGTSYTVTLNTSLLDSHGNALAENYSYRFTVGDDFVAPEILSVTCVSDGGNPIELAEDVQTEHCEKDASLIITFSEPVVREKVANAVRISPSQSFYLDAPSLAEKMTIKFQEALESETSYELTISPTISDAGGNILSREYRYRFITNGARSTRPAITCITDTLHGFIPPFDEGTYECFAHGDIEPVSIYDTDEYIYLIFNKEMKPERMNISIMRALGSSGSGLPEMSQIDWPTTSHGAFRVYRFFLSGIDANNVYRITVLGGSSGIEDSYGNTMKEDYHQYFKVSAK